MDRLQELSAAFGQYVEKYNKYLELVCAHEQSFLVDVFSSYRGIEDPSDTTLLREAAKQFNDCIPRVRSLLKELFEHSPKGNILIEVSSVIGRITVPEETGFIVGTEERENAQECNILLAQINLLVARKGKVKGHRTKETEIDRVHEFSLLLVQYMKLYNEFVKLVCASEQSFLEDFLEACMEEEYPSEILYKPHVRRAAKQLNEFEKRVVDSSNVLSKEFPKGTIFKRVSKLIEQRAVHETDFVVTRVEGGHIQECLELFKLIQQFVSSISSPENDTPRKDARSKETRGGLVSTISRLALAQFANLKGRRERTPNLLSKFVSTFQKYLQLPSLTFPFLNWYWVWNCKFIRRRNRLECYDHLLRVRRIPGQ